MSRENSNKSTVTIEVAVNQALDEIEELFKTKVAVRGLTTGFKDLDGILSGLQNADLIVIGARPSMGKTCFIMNIVEHIGIVKKKPVAIFSLERSAVKVAFTMLASQSKINGVKLRLGALANDDWPKLSDALLRIRDSPIVIDDTPGLTVYEIISRAKSLHRDYADGFSVIIIDYMQLIQPSDKNASRNESISVITRSLKLLARELNIPVIVTSQLKRSLESRDNKRPRMSDLKWGGSIEQDADVILFIYRDEVYNESSDQNGMAEITIAKQRNGPIGKVRLVFSGEFTRFENYSAAHSYNE